MKNLVVSKICITFANEIRNDKEFFENSETIIKMKMTFRRKYQMC